jgi:glucose-1-phosphate cytidylyltransferase
VQVVILAGGLGTRLAEETDLIPKPMVKIGDEPILVHIMRIFAKFGHKQFIVAMGYKQEVIQEYFRDNFERFRNEGWEISLVDTGLSSSTGGRLSRIMPLINSTFFMTYGDGLSDINLELLLKHHQEMNRIATVTAVRPPARFGTIEISNGVVKGFSEKDPQASGWINGGFFCLDKEIENYLMGDDVSFESDPINKIVSENQLSAYEHSGWWQPMDTLREKIILQELWLSGKAPWII